MFIQYIDNIPIAFEREEILKACDNWVQDKKAGYICTINADLLVHSHKNSTYKTILQQSLLNICDGSVLGLSISIIKKIHVTSFPGPDFFSTMLSLKKYKSMFIGSDALTLEKLRTNLSRIDPTIPEMLFMPLPFAKVEDFDYQSIAQTIQENNPDFIWVSLGAPKQEIFASRLSSMIEHGIVVPVGAAFPFFAGTVRRAPRYFIHLKLEWFWRLLTERRKTAKRLLEEIWIVPRILLKEYLTR